MAKRKPELPRAETGQLKIGDLVGLHPDLLQLLTDLSVPPLGAAHRHLLPTQLAQLLEVYPILVTKLRDGVVCSGNIRLFHIAKAVFPDDEAIAVRLEEAIPHKDLTRRAVAEILFGNVLALNHREARTMMAIADRALDRNYLTGSKVQLEKLIAATFGVDRRTLRIEKKVGVLAPQASTADEQPCADQEPRQPQPVCAPEEPEL